MNLLPVTFFEGGEVLAARPRPAGSNAAAELAPGLRSAICSAGFWLATSLSRSGIALASPQGKPPVRNFESKRQRSRLFMNSEEVNTTNEPAFSPVSRRRNRPGTASAQTRAFRNRGVIGGLLLAPPGVAVVFSTPLIRHDSPLDHVTESLGLSFFLLYLFMRAWATMYVGDRKQKELVTEGPYSICRNPLYLGSFCSAIAIALFLNSITLLIVTAMAALVYCRAVIPSEEAGLRCQFGEAYERYARQTPRMLPSLRCYQARATVEVRLAGMRREMKRLILSLLLLIGAFTLCHLRALPWWPHYFILP